MKDTRNHSCPDCAQPGRRGFLKTAAAAAAATGALPLFATPRVEAAPGEKSERLVADLYSTLTSAQREKVCFPYEHELRKKVSANWEIVPETIGGFFNKDQQELIRQIFVGAHSSEEWAERRLKQLQDDGGGLQNYHVALFGEPNTQRFQWVMSGRHITMRVDGDSEPGVAFGGPIFYGHAGNGEFNEKPDHPGNVYWYQGLRANEVFQALNGKQREKALVHGPVPAEGPGTLMRRAAARRPGLPVAEMTRDQQELVGKVLEDLLAPMRKSCADEAERYINDHGGVRSLHMSFFADEDIGNDGVWDVWRLEGPSMVWYFRGYPHVHTWVYIHDDRNDLLP